MTFEDINKLLIKSRRNRENPVNINNSKRVDL